MKIYGDTRSGNCYKIQLILELLDKEYEWQHVDILKGETKTHEFLALSKTGQIPILVTDDGEVVTESNAILYYLAKDTVYFPFNTLKQARVLAWQFFEQYSHEPYIAVARFINIYLGLPEAKKEEYLAKQAEGYEALDIMNTHLESHEYFGMEHLSIADISLFAYTHKAHEGGFDLLGYCYINQWLERIKSHPRFIPMSKA